GALRPRVAVRELRWIRPIGMAIRAMRAQAAEAQQLVLTLMSWLGDSPTAWPINSELGDLAKVAAPLRRPPFRFLRYDIRLEQGWLDRELGVHIDERLLAQYQRLDAPANIPAIYALGAQAAERQVKAEHLVRGGLPTTGAIRSRPGNTPHPRSATRSRRGAPPPAGEWCAACRPRARPA